MPNVEGRIWYITRVFLLFFFNQLRRLRRGNTALAGSLLVKRFFIASARDYDGILVLDGVDDELIG